MCGVLGEGTRADAARRHLMNRNSLYVVIAVLVAAVIGLGAYMWREESKPDGVEIKIDKNGLSVEQN
jgi:hypothetical protein